MSVQTTIWFECFCIFILFLFFSPLSCHTYECFLQLTVMTDYSSLCCAGQSYALYCCPCRHCHSCWKCMANTNQRSTLDSIRFVSWNVRGLGGPVKRSRVFSHLKDLKTDIAFLQETHMRICDHTRLRKPWVGQMFHSSYDSRSRGTAI